MQHAHNLAPHAVLSFAVCVGVAALSAHAHACDAPGTAFKPVGEVVMYFQTTPAKIEVSKPFAVSLAGCGFTPAQVTKVDAHMPAHRHGMNYVPKLSLSPNGAARAEGLVFHMPGAWELVVEVTQPTGKLRLTYPITLE
jgi:hypothetical protein